MIRLRETRASWVLIAGAFAAMLFGLKLWLIANYGNATPFWDQWDSEAAFLYQPWLEGTLSWTDFFAPHNEHRIAMTKLLALGLLAVNGIWNPLLQMIVNAALHVLALLVAIALMARALREGQMPAMLIFALALFGVPYAWENTLAGFQSQFYFLLLFGTLGVWLTTVRVPLSAHWWLGVGISGLSFLSMASGTLSFAASAGVAIVVYALRLRRDRRQVAAIVLLAGLSVLCFLLTPVVEAHAVLRSRSWSQFEANALAAFSWPLGTHLAAAALRNAPAIAFMAMMVVKRPAANDASWFVLGLLLWTMAQALGIAYGRSDAVLSSRYLDLFAIAVLVNFACLLWLVEVFRVRRGAAVSATVAWLAVVAVALGTYAKTSDLEGQLAGKRQASLTEERNTRDFVLTGDRSYLDSKPHLAIPYPHADRLASLLALRELRSVLPANIHAPLAAAGMDAQPPDAFVNDGYYPTTPKPGEKAWGSYTAQGNAATGRATVRFEGVARPAILAIPVAGYPKAAGMKIEIVQGQRREPVELGANPAESWAVGYAKVGKGPFALVLDDGSAKTWLAAAQPTPMGRLDILAALLLLHYYLPFLLGAIALVAWMTVNRGRAPDAVVARSE